jgi:hypothetical protein
MWWDSTRAMMFFWNGTRWQHVLRVFAGTLSSGAILIPAGFMSQVGLNTQINAGYIMTDAFGVPFRDSEGNFLTTETPVSSNDTGSLVKLDGIELIGQANENIPKFTAVYFINGRIARASSTAPFNITKAPIGVVVVDTYQNDTVGVVTAGKQITNEMWNWSLSDIGKPVYCDDLGNITTTKPLAHKNMRVGVIVSSKSVLLTLDWETDIFLPDVGISGISANAPLTISGSPDFPVISIPRASLSQDGYIAFTDFARIQLLENQMPTKSDVGHVHVAANITDLMSLLNLKADLIHGHSIADIALLQTTLDGKAPTVHTHVIADVANLQSSLDALSVQISTKIPKVVGPTAGNFAALTLSGDIVDSGSSATSFALASHSHAIADVINLQSSLDNKSNVGHAHAIGDITGLLSALDAKSDDGHTHVIADVTGLQSALDLKSDVGHGHVIGDVAGLQTELDGKAPTLHIHTIADVTGLQAALDGKADTIHSHVIADVTGLQVSLNSKANIVHTHAIADTTGLQTALDGKSDVGHGHSITDVTGLQTALNGKSNVGHSHTLVSLNDVAISTPNDGDIVRWNGTVWIAATPVIKPSPLVTVDLYNTAFNFGSAQQHHTHYRCLYSSNGQVLVQPDSFWTGADEYFNNGFNPLNPGPMPIGGSAVFGKHGTGDVSFVPGPGVTINSPETLNITKLHGKVMIVKVGPNTWDIEGNLQLV